MTLCPEMQTETKPLPVRERPATLKQKAMVAPNKPFYWPVIIILAATAGLSALGLFFCWKSPIGEWLHPGSNWFFKRQLVYLVIGVLGSRCSLLRFRSLQREASHDGLPSARSRLSCGRYSRLYSHCLCRGYVGRSANGQDLFCWGSSS